MILLLAEGIKNISLSLSYNFSNSVYTDVSDLSTASAYLSYTINPHKYFLLRYSYGLSKSANQNSFSLLVGHHF